MGTFFLGFLGFGLGSRYVFTVEMRHPNIKDYLKKREWENQDAFRVLNDSYWRAGKLLSLKTYSRGNSFYWKYVFIDQSTFEEWDNYIWRNAMHRKSEIPEGVSYKYYFNTKPHV